MFSIYHSAFLTSVYSAFRFSEPQAVGFALRGSGGNSTAEVTTTHQANTSGVESSAIDLSRWFIVLVGLVSLGLLP